MCLDYTPETIMAMERELRAIVRILDYHNVPRDHEREDRALGISERIERISQAWHASRDEANRYQWLRREISVLLSRAANMEVPEEQPLLYRHHYAGRAWYEPPVSPAAPIEPSGADTGE